MKKCIFYIGEFDMVNENVQAHLVKNNGWIFSSLGYQVMFIGVNRNKTSLSVLNRMPTAMIDGNMPYYELPNTFNVSGVFRCNRIGQYIIELLNEKEKEYDIRYVITYQAPTYAFSLKQIAKWCRKNNAHYLVNCADLPIFELQSPLRKAVMKSNWNYMHNVNRKYADGVIAVSSFIEEFYRKPGRASVIIPPLFDDSQIDSNVSPNKTATFVYAGTPFKLLGREAAPEGMKDRLDKVIDLFAELSHRGIDYVFHVVGIDKEDYIASVPRHARFLSEEDRIRFHGKKSHADTLRMIAQADFSINYRDENLMTKAGFSTKIVESVSVGTPVIINAISDTFNYLNDGSDAFKLSGDSEIDTRKLMTLCELTREERVSLKQTLLEKRIFSKEAYLDSMEMFLDSLNEEKQI